MSKFIAISQDKLTKAIQEKIARLRDRKPLMEILAGDLENAVQSNFRTEGARLPGGKWKELKPATIKRKKGNASILVGKGNLQNSIARSFNNNEALAGTNLPYAAIHQFGGTINMAARSEIFKRTKNKKGKFKKLPKDFPKRVLGRGYTFGAYQINIPARPFLAVNEDDWATMLGHVVEYVLK